MSIDAVIEGAFGPIASAFSEVVFYSVRVGDSDLPLIVLWLVAGALFFTVYLRFINVRGFAHALRLVRGDFSDPNDPGEVTHFQALATALSGTVGVGNIAHVAVAISVGGPGAAFWMVVAGTLGMASKFAECTLGVKYRQENADGSVSGGPMFFLDRGLRERGLPRLGRALAIYYAVCILVGTLGIGSMFQSNQAYVQMALVYVGAGLVVIAVHITELPSAIGLIVRSAFTPEGTTGGMLGALILGFRRAAFSNEAGIGSAAIAHSAVRTHDPATEGFVALLEPFIDTVIVCSITALVITLTVYDPAAPASGMSGVELTSSAFATVLPWFPVPLAGVVMLFAYSTMIAWSYYGLEGWIYLFGNAKRTKLTYNAIFCMSVVVGCTTTLEAILDFSDAMIFAMALANMLGLYLLAPVVRQEMEGYRARIASGEIRSRS
jgi:AGCS family alanine or glycine:cation symporter